jgi:crotonobetainyl-CoA:carnitine CoA-transferase CaiB-like acyl-CoA transferase
MSELIQDADGQFRGAPLIDAERTGFHPAESLYECADGWIAVVARDEPMAARLAAALGLLELGQRAQWGDGERRQIGACLRRLSVEEALSLLERTEVWAERCVQDGLEAMMAEPRAHADGVLTDVDDPRYGKVTGLLGPLMTFSRSRIDAGGLRPFPEIGQHTREVLHDIGYSDAKVDELQAAKVIVA